MGILAIPPGGVLYIYTCAHLAQAGATVAQACMAAHCVGV